MSKSQKRKLTAGAGDQSIAKFFKAAASPEVKKGIPLVVKKLSQTPSLFISKIQPQQDIEKRKSSPHLKKGKEIVVVDDDDDIIFLEKTLHHSNLDKKSQENVEAIAEKEIRNDKVKDDKLQSSSNLEMVRKDNKKETREFDEEKGNDLKQNKQISPESPYKISSTKRNQIKGLMSPILDRLSRERPEPSWQDISPNNEINLISGDLTIKTPRQKGKQLQFEDFTPKTNQTKEKERYFEDENPIPSSSDHTSRLQSPKDFEFEMDQIVGVENEGDLVVSAKEGNKEEQVVSAKVAYEEDQEESVEVGNENMYSFLDESNSNLFEEDSEDEDLPEAPALSTIPTRVFELKKTPSSQYSSPANIDEIKDSPALSTSVSGTPADTAHFSLDMLLAEKTENEPSNRELEQMTKEMKEDLKKGGINKIADMSLGPTDDLSAEQKEQLEMLEVKPQEVKTHHPGDEIFVSTSFLKLFDQKSLTLQSCGFVTGQSFIDKKLSSLNQEMVLELLKSDVITLCFDAIGKPKVFLTWLFKLMSVHGNTFVVHSIHKLLYSILHKQSGNGVTWVPSLVDICQIFINYGAKFKDLCPHSRFVPFSEDEVCSNVKENTQPLLRQQNNSNLQYSIENLKFVLQVLADAITERSTLYKESELVTLLLMIMKVSIDKRLNLGVLKYDFVVCVSAILNAFSTKSWPKRALELCGLLPKVSEHHHNKVYLVQVLPPTTRGLYLQRRLGLCMLYQLLYKTSFANNVETIMLKQLHPILEELHKKTNSDFYYLSSMVFLIDLCVGNETLGSSERSDLEQLVTKVCKMKGEVREYVNKMDRTLVKDQMVRLTSKWTFMLQNMGTKQRSIFAYTQQDMPVKKLESSQIEEDSESDQDDKMESECDTDNKETCTVQVKKEKNANENVDSIMESESAISIQNRTKSQMYVDITDSDDLPEL